MELMVEFNKLQVPEDDELLLKRRGHFQVTLLGSETHLAEGLKRAREKIRDYPQDLDAIKDYGWILCDGITHAANIKNDNLAKKLFNELEGFKTSIPETEEALLRKVEWCRNIALHDELTRAREASKSGDSHLAMRLYQKALEKQPGSSEVVTSLGWEIQKHLKTLSPKNPDDSHSALELIRKYLKDVHKHIEKPGPLCSQMLRQMTRFAEVNPIYLRCLRVCGKDTFQDEDFERFTPDGSEKSYDSLVEKTIKAVFHAAKALSKSTYKAKQVLGGQYDRDADLKWAAEFVGDCYDQFPDQEWFPYYYGKLLIMVGDIERARPFIRDIVKLKRNEFWAWDNLAATYSADEPHCKIACLCRALNCPVQNEAYLVNVHSELAKLLIEEKCFPEAKTEVDKVIQIRKANNWVAKQEVMAPELQDWYKTASSLPDNSALYNEKALVADKILFSDAQWTEAVIIGKVPPVEGRSGKTYIGFLEGGELQEVPVKTSRYSEIEGLKSGSPLRIVLDNQKGRNSIVNIDERKGANWDVIPVRIGLVKHINSEKGITAVALGKRDFCLIPHSRFDDVSSFSNGDAVAIRVRKDRKRDQLVPLTIEKTDAIPSNEFAGKFTGRLKVHTNGRFGFVEDIYVPHALLELLTVSDGEVVSGQSICEWNSRKNEYGWRAVTIKLEK